MYYVLFVCAHCVGTRAIGGRSTRNKTSYFAEKKIISHMSMACGAGDQNVSRHCWRHEATTLPKKHVLIPPLNSRQLPALQHVHVQAFVPPFPTPRHTPTDAPSHRRSMDGSIDARAPGPRHATPCRSLIPVPPGAEERRRETRGHCPSPAHNNRDVSRPFTPPPPTANP